MSKKSEFPSPEKVASLSTKIDEALLIETKKECKARKISLRAAIEFGLSKFLEESERQK